MEIKKCGLKPSGWPPGNRAAGTVPDARWVQAEVQVYDTCERCRRGLTDPRSMAIGFGPDCRRSMGLDVGELQYLVQSRRRWQELKLAEAAMVANRQAESQVDGVLFQSPGEPWPASRCASCSREVPVC